MGVVDPGLVLVSGPSRSGKSRWAEHLAASSGLAVTYLATGAHRPGDPSWQQRLQLHRQRRPAHWTTLEVGGELEASLEAFIPAHQHQGPAERSPLPAPLASQNGEEAAAQDLDAPSTPPGNLVSQGVIGPDQLLLIDSLGTWLAHHLELAEPAWLLRQQRLLTALQGQPARVIFVCEEVGWGVVPPTAIGGLFRDRCGSLQQRLMQQAQEAWLVVQGRALNLMALGEAVPPAGPS